MKNALHDIHFEGKDKVLHAIENLPKETISQKINRFLSREVEIPLSGLFAVGVATLLLIAVPIQLHLNSTKTEPQPYTIRVIEGGTQHETYY